MRHCRSGRLRPGSIYRRSCNDVTFEVRIRFDLAVDAGDGACRMLRLLLLLLRLDARGGPEECVNDIAATSAARRPADDRSPALATVEDRPLVSASVRPSRIRLKSPCTLSNRRAVQCHIRTHTKSLPGFRNFAVYRP